MRRCNKCDDIIPNRIIIDNKSKNISSRKYCIQCSPFGLHNTKKIHIKKNEIKCQFCSDILSGNQKKFCSIKCKNKYINVNSTYNGTFYSKRRRYVRKYQLIMNNGGMCNVCGYDKNIAALEFHHIDSTTKLFELNSQNLSSKKMKVLLEEVKKCLLLCANCHRELHNIEYTKDNLKKFMTKKLEL